MKRRADSNTQEPKFTPEPWSVGTLNDGDRPRFTVERGDGHIIAYVEEKADANLISAALDMYQALYGFLLVWHNRANHRDPLFVQVLDIAAKHAIAAKAKAEGR